MKGHLSDPKRQNCPMKFMKSVKLIAISDYEAKIVILKFLSSANMYVNWCLKYFEVIFEPLTTVQVILENVTKTYYDRML